MEIDKEEERRGRGLGGRFEFWVLRLKDIPARRSLKRTHPSHHLHLLRRRARGAYGGQRQRAVARPCHRLKRSSGRQARSRRPHPRRERQKRSERSLLVVGPWSPAVPGAPGEPRAESSARKDCRRPEAAVPALLCISPCVPPPKP